MILKRALPLLVAVLLCLGTTRSALFAQGTDLGTIRGTVTDSTGAVVSKASVDITDESTNTVRHFSTDARGDYEAAALKSGRYKATVTAEGFGATMVVGINLVGTATARADAVLRVSSSESTVEVSANAYTINTEDSTISETLAPKAIVDLPRDSRDVYQFLYLNPNITQGNGPGSFKFIGGQSYGASFSVDGQRSNGGIFGSQTQSQPSLESVGEVNVLDNTFSSEYAGIANIRVNTKRGGDTYHGSVLYDNSNSALSAWSAQAKLNKMTFAPTAFQSTYKHPRSNNTDLAASTGGPIPGLKKTWFFMAYEKNWSIFPSTTRGNVPHPTVSAGNFSLIKDSKKPNVPGNISLTPDEIANDTVGGLGKQFITIPQRLLNPVTTKLVSLYFPVIGNTAPISSSTGIVSGYSSSVPAHSSSQLGDLRVDHDFNDNNRLYGVYHGSQQNTAAAPVATVYSGLGLLQVDRENSTLSLSYTHIFTANIVNEARGGYNIQHLYDHANTTVGGFLTSIGFSSADVAAYGSVVGASQLKIHGNPIIGFGSGGNTYDSFSGGGRSGERNLDQNLLTFGDSFTWTHGRHTFKAGADFVRNQAVDGFAATRSNPGGTLNYRGTQLNAMAQFLLGEPLNNSASAFNPRPAMNVHNWENGYFVQDDFRVSAKLTLNIGVRYELFNPYIEKNGVEANFDPNYSNSTTGQLGRFVIPSAKALQYLSPGAQAIGVVLASQSGLGVGPGLVKTDKTDLGPRVGAAYRITEKSVLRGGFGLYTPTSSAHIYRDSIMTNPFNQGLTTLRGSLSQGWPTGGETTGVSPNQGGVVAGYGNTPSANYVPVDLKNPRLYEWNSSFEHELPMASSVRVSYIGSHQTGQIMGADLDQIAPNSNPFSTTQDTTGSGFGDGVTPCDPGAYNCSFSPADNARYKFPALGTFVTGFRNFGHSLTSALQGEVKHRSSGLTLSAAYTLTSQNSSGSDVGQDSMGGTPYDATHPENEYGRDNWVSRHRLVAYGIYDLPFGRGKRFDTSSRLLDQVIGGWQTSFNMFAKSGVAFTPYWGCGNCDAGPQPGNVGTPDIAADGSNQNTYRPRQIGNPNSGAAPGYKWNITAFDLPPIGADMVSNPSVVRRNTLTGPGSWGSNLGIHKAFQVSDRVSFQLGADVDNVFNHPMYSPDQGNGFGNFARLGSFDLGVSQDAPAPGQQPGIFISDSTPNTAAGGANSPYADNFGQNFASYSQEGISANRQIRLRGRITF